MTRSEVLRGITTRSPASRTTEQRGRDTATRWAPHLIATHHPAAILRVDPDDRGRYEAELAADLATAHALLC